jgi:cytochrome c biogenesis protein CcmG/thiol:disulfide interchange protein DsbE
VSDRPAFSHRPRRQGLIGPFGGRQLLGGALVIIVTAVLLVIVTTPLGTPGVIGPGDPLATQFALGTQPPNGLKAGDIPPDLTVATANGGRAYLSDLEGQPVRLVDLRGRAVWLNFWASWCPPCQSETPILRDLAERYRDRGLVVVGISVQESSPANVADYVRRYQLDYTIATDSTGEIFRNWRLYGLPTQFFIGPEGAIRSVVPAPMTEARAIAQIEAILPRAPGSAPASPPASPAPSQAAPS